MYIFYKINAWFRTSKTAGRSLLFVPFYFWCFVSEVTSVKRNFGGWGLGGAGGEGRGG